MKETTECGWRREETLNNMHNIRNAIETGLISDAVF